MLLENDYLLAEFTPKGAECLRLYDKKTQREILWSGDPTFWGRHAPVLFPFVGRLKQDTYEYQGEAYSLGQHGFARDQEFQLTQQTADQLAFTLKNNHQTEAVYPFPFELTVRYCLKERTLETHYQIKNSGTDVLYYSVGGHPAFQTPISKTQPFEEYWFAFEKTGERQRIPLEGPYSQFAAERAETVKKQALSRDLFQKDALIYRTSPQETLYLGYGEQPLLAFHFENFLFVGVWSPYPAEAPFVCFEPWLGIADKQDASGRLEDKAAIQTLARGEVKKLQYSVEILN